MSVLSGKEIRKLGIMDPHHSRTIHKETGTSYGEGPATYDIRLAHSVTLRKGRTVLGTSIERFAMPNNVCGGVKDKSTWVREGIYVNNTFIDPGWCGYLTLEIGFAPVFENDDFVDLVYYHLKAGTPIAHIKFDLVIGEVEPYSGKYQNQECRPIRAIFEK